ncbi:L-arabinonolactonase [Burkholderiales bacterium]|nr:L-arabinonolactonase [Burkholderiales bacterium]
MAPRAMSAAPALEVVARTANEVGESPVWHAAERAVYWTDIPACTVHRLDVSTGAHRHWMVDDMVGCLAVAADGDLIAGTGRGVARFRCGDGPAATLERVADVAHPREGMRANDGRCDRQGRFWFGTMLMDMAAGANVGGLYVHEHGRGLAGPVVRGLVVQNGLAFSPDGRTMYLSDSHPSVRQIWAYDFDPDSGTPSNRRTFVDMNRHPGRPDGAAIDETGAYWCCANDGGSIHRFAPDGRLLTSIPLPVSKPSMAAFGGDALEWLYITSIRPPAPRGASEPLAGTLLAFRPGIHGVAETPYACKPEGVCPLVPCRPAPVS